MLGDSLRVWFALFSGIDIHRPGPGGGHVTDAWLNWKDIEDRFSSGGLRFGGRPYDPADHDQRERLLKNIVQYGGTFVRCKLLERRRQINPPSLDYRLTPFGRRVERWGSGERPGLRSRAFFLVVAVVLRAYRYRWIITVGGACWGALNAFRFYALATSTLESLPFMTWSAAGIAIIVAVWIGIKSRIGD